MCPQVRLTSLASRGGKVCYLTTSGRRFTPEPLLTPSRLKTKPQVTSGALIGPNRNEPADQAPKRLGRASVSIPGSSTEEHAGRNIKMRCRSSPAVCIRAPEYADDGDSLQFVIDPVDHTIGPATCAVSIVQGRSELLANLVRVEQ